MTTEVLGGHQVELTPGEVLSQVGTLRGNVCVQIELAGVLVERRTALAEMSTAVTCHP
jgi:hypothetical protein